jgi:DNA-binding Lrp family transcriptional regulator
MDDIDRKILAEVQRDARLTVTELASRVGLSLSPCHRRLRALEESGAIEGYHAQINPDTVGLSFEALIFVTMRNSSKKTLETFEDAVQRIPNIVQAQRLYGMPDYLLRVFTRDQAAFLKLYDARLSALPGIERVSTTLVMKRVVDEKPMPF